MTLLLSCGWFDLFATKVVFFEKHGLQWPLFNIGFCFLTDLLFSIVVSPFLSLKFLFWWYAIIGCFIIGYCRLLQGWLRFKRLESMTWFSGGANLMEGCILLSSSMNDCSPPSVPFQMKKNHPCIVIMWLFCL